MKLEKTTFFGDEASVMHGSDPEESIKAIIQEDSDSAFMVMNVDDVVHKILNWRQKMPRIQPFYAVKCNGHPTILQILNSLGTGFDVASKKEIVTMLDHGVDPSRMIFAHPTKTRSQMLFALEEGVDLMTFDNASELQKLAEMKSDVEPRLVIRIRCDAAEAQCPLGIKYGIEPHLAGNLLRLAKELCLNVVGVSFHVGSGCKEYAVYRRAIKASRKVFNQAIELGFDPYLLDIGGGFPGDEKSSIDEPADIINSAIDKYFPPDGKIEIIAEPGRYVVASAFTLATRVISLRKIEPAPNGARNESAWGNNDDVSSDEDDFTVDKANGNANAANGNLPCLPIDASTAFKGLNGHIQDLISLAECNANDANGCNDVKKKGKAEANGQKLTSYLYYLNDGIYGSLNCIFYDHQQVYPEVMYKDFRPVDQNGPRYPSTLFGPTCDSADCIAQGIMLPQLKVDDWVFFRNMGAYTISAAGSFNGMPLPDIHILVPANAWISFDPILSASALRPQKSHQEEDPSEASFFARHLTDQDVSVADQLNNSFNRLGIEI